MNYKLNSIGVIASICLFITGCEFTDKKEESGILIQENQKQEKRQEKTQETLCNIEPVKKVIQGDSMAPLLADGEVIYLYPEYYQLCKEIPKIGDLVAHDFAGEDIPIIKKVIATDADHIIIKNKTLWVNQKEVTNTLGQSYSFSDGEQKLMNLYIKNNTLPKGSIFILGDNINNSKDSRKFGAISVNNLLGKFERM